MRSFVLGIGAPALAVAALVVFAALFVLFDFPALFDAIEDQAPLAPSAFAPETAARETPQQLTQDPANYDLKAAVRAEQRRLESERTSINAEIFAREMLKANAPTSANTQNMARQFAPSSPQSIASGSSDLPSDAIASVDGSAADATPTAPASPWRAGDSDSPVRAVAPDFSELGSVSPPSGVQTAVPPPRSLEASIDSTPPPPGNTGGVAPSSDTTNALSAPPSDTLVAPAPTPFDPMTIVSALPPASPTVVSTPRPDASDISSLRSPETPSVTAPPLSNAATADSTPRSDEPVVSPPLLDAPTIVSALPPASPTVVSTPRPNASDISSLRSPETPTLTPPSNAATTDSTPRSDEPVVSPPLLDAPTIVSALPSASPTVVSTPRPDASDISSLRSLETPALRPPPPSNAATADSTPRSDEPVVSTPPLDAPTIVSALPSASPIVVPTPHSDERSVSSPPPPDTQAVDSALHWNAATVALKPPATTSAVVGISSSNTSHIALALPANTATPAASPPVIAARIEGERISPTISTEIGSLNEDKPTQAVVDRKLDRNFSAATALLPDGMPPRVLIRYDGYSAEARRRAETFAKSLAEQGYEIADVRKVASPVRSELRFFYAPDEAIASHIGHLTGVNTVRAPLPKVGLMGRPGLIELSVSAR